jgi:hypothetical protein
VFETRLQVAQKIETFVIFLFQEWNKTSASRVLLRREHGLQTARWQRLWSIFKKIEQISQNFSLASRTNPPI